MKEEWLLNGAVVPVDVETTAALVAEIHRLIDVVGGMALAQPEQERPWVGLTDEEIKILWIQYRAALPRYLCFARAVLAKSKEKNNG